MQDSSLQYFYNDFRSIRNLIVPLHGSRYIFQDKYDAVKFKDKGVKTLFLTFLT